jgi:polyhydroxyalkanoate synthase
MPVAMHSFYLREMYLRNRLAEPGGITLNGVPLDLADVRIPVFLQSSREDHIAPYPSVYKATRLFSGPVTFMLAGSGHIAGVINPPEANKYYYYSNPEVADDVEDWIGAAEYNEGSWWPYWHRWLYRRSGRKVSAREPGDGDLQVIEDAPGRYVTMK